MVNSEDIKKLAFLSRIELSAEEENAFAREIDAILGYVSQISSVTGSGETPLPPLHNIFRADGEPHESGLYSEPLLAQAPDRQGDYFKVKKILSHD